MSELKDYKVYTTRHEGAWGYHYEPNPNKDQSDIELNGEQVYLKKDADKVIAELEEERRWRKCSDEMPEDGAEVLASDGVGIWLCYKTTLSDGSPWFQPDGLPHIEGVTYWMPLPSAPKEAK